MKTFEDLKFKQRQHPYGGVQAIMEFDNGHRISVIGGSQDVYGDAINTWEIWRSCDSDVKGWLTKEEVTEEMKSLQELPVGSEHDPMGY